MHHFLYKCLDIFPPKCKFFVPEHIKDTKDIEFHTSSFQHWYPDCIYFIMGQSQIGARKRKSAAPKKAAVSRYFNI